MCLSIKLVVVIGDGIYTKLCKDLTLIYPLKNDTIQQLLSQVFPSARPILTRALAMSRGLTVGAMISKPPFDTGFDSFRWREKFNGTNPLVKSKF